MLATAGCFTRYFYAAYAAARCRAAAIAADVSLLSYAAICRLRICHSYFALPYMPPFRSLIFSPAADFACRCIALSAPRCRHVTLS